MSLEVDVDQLDEQAFIEDNLASSDPSKVTAAILKLIHLVVQANRDVSVYVDLFLKQAFTPNVEKSVKLLSYVALRCLRLSLDQWEKLSGYILTDLSSNDIEVKIAALKTFDYTPDKVVEETIGAGVINLITFLQFEDQHRAEEASLLRSTAAQTLTSLLIFRKMLQQNNNFNVAAWSALTERVLTDPSQKVVKSSLEALYMLFSEVYGNKRYRPIEKNETESSTLAHLQKYATVVVTKLTPNMDVLIRRLHWLSADAKYFVLFPLVCVIANVAETNWTNTMPKIGFITSPRHFVVEIIERELLPLVNRREEALILEAGICVAYLCRRTDINKPAWILAVCNAFLGLLERESARSVAKKVMMELFNVLDLLPPHLLLPVIIRTLQRIEGLQLSSSHARLTFVNRSLSAVISKSIALSEAETTGSDDGSDSQQNIPLKMISELVQHNWMQKILKHKNEQLYHEEVWTTLMRQVLQAYLQRCKVLRNSGQPDSKNLWSEPLYVVTLAGAKCLEWKCHVRTYCFETYLKCLDVTCHSLQTGTKLARKKLKELLHKVISTIPKIKSDPIALRVIYLFAKHSPKGTDKTEQSHVITIEAGDGNTESKKSAGGDFIPPPPPLPSASGSAPSTSAGKGKLGLKVDQLKKTNLSHQDIELLAVVLNMFVNHPDLSKDPIMRDYLKQYILQLSTATKAADAVTYQRFKLLHASTISFYRSFLKRSSGQLSDMDDISLLLPWHTHSYCPPIEYLEKTIVDKHPDDDFLLQSSKIQLAMTKSGKHNEATRSYGRYKTITAPSDPIMARVSYRIVDDCSVAVFMQISNITSIVIPRMTALISLRGRIEQISDTRTFLQFDNVQPAQLIETQVSLKLSSFSVNSLHIRFLLFPALDKPNTLEINCLPYRLNVHQLFKPWLIDYAEFLRQWNRFPNAFSFRATVDDKAQLRGLAHKISSYYRCVIDWDYAADAYFQAAFSALTLWDENVLFTVSGTTLTDREGVILRFEVRASSLNLLVILDNHREEWLQDLLGGTSKIIAEAAADSNQGQNMSWGSDFVTPFDRTKPTKYSTPYSEDALLQKWHLARQNLVV